VAQIGAEVLAPNARNAPNARKSEKTAVLFGKVVALESGKGFTQ